MILGKKYKYLVIFVLVLVIVYLIAFFRDRHRERMLLNNDITYGVITDFAIGGKGPGKMVVRFKVDPKIISATYHSSLVECNDKIGISDTVLIKYSKSDNSIIQLLKCYWNEELREKYVKSK